MQHNEEFYQNRLHDNVASFFDIVFSPEWIGGVELAIFRINGLYKNMSKSEKIDALRIFDNFLNLEIDFLDKILKNL